MRVALGRLASGGALPDLVGIGRVAAQAVSILVVARVFGPATFGEYIALTTLLAIAAPLVPLGLDVALARDGGRHATRAGICFGVGMGLIASVIASVGAAGLLGLWGVVDVSLLLLAVVAVTECLQVVVAQHGFRLMSARDRALPAILTLGVPAWTKVCWSTVVVVLTPSLEEALALLTSMNALALFVASLRLYFTAAQSQDALPLRALLIDGIAYASAFGARSVVYEVPRLILVTAGSSATLGLFSVAGRMAQLGLVPSTAYLANRAPIIMHPLTIASELRSVLRRAFLLSVGAALLGVAGVPLLTVLLGEEYAPARPLYALLLLWLPITTISLFVYEVTSLRFPGRITVGLPVAAAGVMALSTYAGNALAGGVGVVAAVVVTEAAIAACGLFALHGLWSRKGGQNV